MSRYPYTHGADFIRKHGPQTGPFSSPVLSRADAAALKRKIAEALGIPEKESAEKLADALLAEEAAMSAKMGENISPQIDARHNRELGGDWVTCYGCPSFRIHDFHYFYCRALGDQGKDDHPYSGGLRRLERISFDRQRGDDCPCQKEPSYD